MNSVVHTIARDEDYLLNEWLVHHILLGFEHIYIYDDNSMFPITEKIKELPIWVQQKITVYRLDCEFCNLTLTSKYYDDILYKQSIKNKQTYFLNYFVKTHQHIAKWCFFADCDEFIYLKQNDNINSFLEKYDKYNILVIPWLIYGTSFHIDTPKGLVIENFTYHEDKYFNIGKCIAKITEMDLTNMPLTNVHNLILPDYKDKHFTSFSNIVYVFDSSQDLYNLNIHINHYQITSLKSYITRKLKGEITNGIRPSKEIFYFATHYNNINDNNIMEKYINSIKTILNIISTDYEKPNTQNMIDVFMLDNDIITECKNLLLLQKMLYSNNIRYLTLDELLPKFNFKDYRELYQHVSHITDYNIIKYHLSYLYNDQIKYKYENIPEDFNPITYIELNQDLKNMTEIEAKNHYENCGFKENRKYYIILLL